MSSGQDNARVVILSYFNQYSFIYYVSFFVFTTYHNYLSTLTAYLVIYIANIKVGILKSVFKSCEVSMDSPRLLK